MRTYDISCAKQTPRMNFPIRDLEDMTLEEIKNKCLSSCAKSNGNVSVCSKCKTPCAHGKRAVELLAKEMSDIPLYDGMTLIERAKLDNMRRRQKEENKEVSKEKRSKDNRLYISDWYGKAMASEDPVEWVMKAYNIDRKRASAKLRQWKKRHNTEEVTAPKVKEDAALIGFESVETKIDSLMKMQDEYKKKVSHYQNLYNEVSKKIDILCSAMDIINE